MHVASLDKQTCRSLEWNELLEILASQAHSAAGAERCRDLQLENEPVRGRLRQRETTDMVVLLDSPHPLPALRFQDIRGLLERSQKGAMLEPRELRDISRVIELVDSAQESLEAQSTPLEALQAIVRDLGDLSPLYAVIGRCISPEGEMLESASPALQTALHESQSLKQHIRQRLEAMIASEQYREVLQEPYFAQRDSRYVLPVKAERQSAMPGIVHDGSASGATVFVEPRDLIDLNNRIKVAELEITREVNRILLELSALVGKEARLLTHYFEILATLDGIAAKARLSKLMKATPVEINAGGRIHLYQARHPVLVLTKNHVMANDLVFREEDRVLVISGPNTGGKTVMLKLIGLFALMVRGGLHLPCGEGSRMGFFGHIFAEVGDGQDIKEDLSSFSGHINNIVQVLATIRTNSEVFAPQYLILLDEVISSTDPAEGAALAEALLVHLAEPGVKVVVTTHYNALKLLALSKPGFVNASFEIHLPSLAPTYRLIQGFPGGSSAFEIAAHLGLDPQILDHARGLLSQKERELEALFSELQAMRSQHNEELSRARDERMAAEKASLEAQEITEELRASRAEAGKIFKRQFREQLHSARLEIQQTIEDLRKDRTAAKAQNALKHLSQLQKRTMQEQEPSHQYVPVTSLHAGDPVEISTLETRGILLDSPGGRKRVRIRVGESEVSVGINLLRGLKTGESPSRVEGKASHRRNDSRESEKVSPQGIKADMFSAMTIDVRGHTIDDALEAITGMLDQAALKHFHTIRIIHGHGTGKLKKAVREYAAQSPYVMTSRAGSMEEGGDGVTMVEMR